MAQAQSPDGPIVDRHATSRLICELVEPDLKTTSFEERTKQLRGSRSQGDLPERKPIKQIHGRRLHLELFGLQVLEHAKLGDSFLVQLAQSLPNLPKEDPFGVVINLQLSDEPLLTGLDAL